MLTKGEIGATFFTFIAVLFEIFVLVSGSGNLPVLRSLYWVAVDSGEQFVRIGLWGSCYGTNGVVKECSTPTVPVRWPQAEGLPISLSVDLPNTIYMAIFILFILACLAMGGALIVALFTFFRKLPNLFLAVVSFLATGAYFIVFIMVVVATAKFKSAAEHVGASASFGPSPWLVLGALIASGLATIWYTWQAFSSSKRRAAPEAFKY